MSEYIIYTFGFFACWAVGIVTGWVVRDWFIERRRDAAEEQRWANDRIRAGR